MIGGGLVLFACDADFYLHIHGRSKHKENINDPSVDPALVMSKGAFVTLSRGNYLPEASLPSSAPRFIPRRQISLKRITIFACLRQGLVKGAYRTRVRRFGIPKLCFNTRIQLSSKISKIHILKKSLPAKFIF